MQALFTNTLKPQLISNRPQPACNRSHMGTNKPRMVAAHGYGPIKFNS